MLETKGHRPIKRTSLASTPWSGKTKEGQGVDPLRHGSVNLQGKCGELCSIWNMVGILMLPFIPACPPSRPGTSACLTEYVIF